MTPADTLRGAATRLRAQIDKLTTDTACWDEAFPSARVYADQSTYERLIAHPDIGAKLAELLEEAAEHVEITPADVAEVGDDWVCGAAREGLSCSVLSGALSLARSILGEEEA